jgi:hypothetical protein
MQLMLILLLNLKKMYMVFFVQGRVIFSYSQLLELPTSDKI